MQPRPTPNDHPASWDTVIRDLYKNCDNPPLEAVVHDIRERDARGERKYGARLQPHNGRDSLLDAYEEALDLTVYLQNAFREGHPVYLLYREALRMVCSLKAVMLKRDEK